MKIKEKILIDTNILIYALDNRSRYFQYSKDIINDNQNNSFITTKNISEFVCVMSKLNQQSLIVKKLEVLSSQFNIIYPDNESLKIFNRLINKYKPVGNRVYDIEIVSIMLRNGIERIVTLNTKDFIEIEETIIISYDEG